MGASSLFADALASHQAGRLDEAERLYAQILAAAPRHADSLHLSGVIAFQQGRHDHAAALIGQAIGIADKVASYHANLGLVRQAQGRLDEAAACQHCAIGLAPDYPEAHNNLGLVLQAQDRLEEAAACYAQAVALNPGLAEAHNNLGNVLEALGRLNEAAASCAAALALRPHYPEAENNLGVVCVRQGHMDAAIVHYRKAIALEPGYGDAHNNLGHALKAEGKFADAATAYRMALERSGDAAIAWHGISACRKFTSDDMLAVAAMTAALASPAQSDTARSLLHFGLGKIFDDLKDHERAIAHFDQGNRLERERHPFDAAAFTTLIDRLIEAFPAGPPSPAASASQVPILIVGLPRSGTTLVEQILASHPAVAAGGEQNFWSQRLDGFRKGRTLDTAGERKAIDDYLGLLGGIAPEAARVTDKMPYNFLWAGAIHRLLPKARLVHCRRSPLDTALSIYVNRFAQPHPFAYDRGDIVHYVNGYLRLMAHWRAVLPPAQFFELDYEALVADQRAVSRTLISFCGLDWNEACMDFFRTERAIDTLSAWQARQPLYRGSVERWRHYEPWLGELRALLPPPN